MVRLLASALVVFLAAVFSAAQTGVPIDSVQPPASSANQLSKDFDEYTLELPNATWRVTSKTGDANVDIIYGDRQDGFLQIRKFSSTAETTMNDVIDREQNQKLQFLPNFVNGKEESFKGALSGRAVNYEFTQSGKPMIGRAYFLEADNKTFYILRFTGSRDKLRLIRNQTDSIARTFKLKK